MSVSSGHGPDGARKLIIRSIPTASNSPSIAFQAVEPVIVRVRVHDLFTSFSSRGLFLESLLLASDGFGLVTTGSASCLLYTSDAADDS